MSLLLNVGGLASGVFVWRFELLESVKLASNSVNQP